MRRLSTASLGLWLLLLSSSTLAAPAAEVAAREAEERFQKGMELARQGRAEDARVMFLEAYSVAPTVRTLWNLGLIELETNHDVDALHHFRAYAADATVAPEKRAAAEARIAQAYARTGHVRITGALGAAISVDGIPAVASARASEEIDVAAGRHVLEARTANRHDRVDVDARAGAVTDADFAAASTGPPRAPGDAASPASTSVPPPAMEGPPVEHRDPQTTSSLRLWTTAGFGAGALASVVGAGILLAAASSDHDHAMALLSGLPAEACTNSNSAACVQENDALQSEASKRNASTGLFLAAIALAGGGVASWFLLAPHQAPASGSVSILPDVSRSAAGLTAIGRF